MFLPSFFPAAQAAELAPPPGYGTLKNITLASLVAGIIQLLLLLSFVAAMIFLLLGGIRWIMAGGDKAAAESARGTLTAAIIGLVIVLLVWAMMRIIEGFFGVPIVSGSFPLPRFFP